MENKGGSQRTGFVQKLEEFLGKFDARDFHVYAGTALLAAGLGFVWWQAALIAPGVIFIYIALRRVDIGHPKQH